MYEQQYIYYSGTSEDVEVKLHLESAARMPLAVAPCALFGFLLEYRKATNKSASLDCVYMQAGHETFS
jgi:hypothetical protein